MLELFVLNPPKRKAPHNKAKKFKKAKARKRKTVARKKAKKKRRYSHIHYGRVRRKKAKARKKVRRKAPRRKRVRSRTAARRPRRKTTRSRRSRRRPITFRGKYYNTRIKRGTRKKPRRVPRWKMRRIRAAARGSRRANPALGLSVKGVTKQLKSVFTMKTAYSVGHGLMGASLALMIPPYAAKWTKQRWLDQGYMGIASSALASVVAAAAAHSLGFKGAAPKILAGGLLATGSKALKSLLPAQWSKWIPSISVSATPSPMALPTTLSPLSAGVSGMGRMGSYMSADQLIRGEAAAQGMGDFMNLKGLGQARQIPRSSIAGIGLGDYMTFAQYPSVPQAVGIPQFDAPAGEDF